VTRYVFRAIWPVLDETTPLLELLSDASDELPAITRRAHVELAGRPRWSIQPGWQIPGSGGAMFVVVCEIAAHPTT
jgi:hypothetical protein